MAYFGWHCYQMLDYTQRPLNNFKENHRFNVCTEGKNSSACLPTNCKHSKHVVSKNDFNDPTFIIYLLYIHVKYEQMKLQMKVWYPCRTLNFTHMLWFSHVAHTYTHCRWVLIMTNIRNVITSKDLPPQFTCSNISFIAHL